MQDLVGVGVADAGEEARIGERALEGVVLAFNRAGELRQIRFEDLDAARVHRLQRRLALHQMQRGAPLRAGLGERQRAVLELEERERAARLLAGPVQAAGDHQVQHEEELVLEPEDDALAEPGQPRTVLPSTAAKGGTAVRSRNGLKSPTAPAGGRNPPLQALEVDSKVGKLGQWDESRS